MMQLDGQEKRRHRRLRVPEAQVRISVRDEARAAAVDNISTGGLCLLGDEQLTSGEPVMVFLTPRGWSRSLKLPGRVLASSLHGAESQPRVASHIKFDALTAEPAALLMKLLHGLSLEREVAPAADTGAPLGVPDEGGEPQATVLDLGLLAMGSPRPLEPTRVPSQSELFHRREVALQAVQPGPSPSPPALPVSNELSTVRGQLRKALDRIDELAHEVAALTAQLATRDLLVAKAEQERKSALLALQRLSEQLVNSR